MYHAGWAWAGGTPFKGTKLVASYFGGTRNPLVISWPAKIRPSNQIRSQFHHVVDIVPTIYDILGITPPKVVEGHPQIQFDGVSMTYTFDNPEAPTTKTEQFFDNFASRGIYQDGWMGCTVGPTLPWDPANNAQRIKAWDSASDRWELYDLRNDFSQAIDLADEHPAKLEELKSRFLELAQENQDLPIGAALWTRLRPEDVVATPYTQWTFHGRTRRMPEFTAPGLGKKSNVVDLDLQTEANATGVLYALGGASAGLTCYMDDGYLCYEYNLFIVERYTVKSNHRLSAGEHKIVIDTNIPRPGGPATIKVIVDNEPVGILTTKRSAPAAFTASETFDVGIDLGSPVSRSYSERRPFEFDGNIERVQVRLK